jgi:ABC-type sugar transport system substrate-binding protein
VTTAGTVTAQTRLLGTAIAARPRALVIDPVDYAALLPYLHAAHDAEVPVVLLQTPRDVANPTFVAAFVAPDQDSLDAQTAVELARLLPGPRMAQIGVISAIPSPRTAGATATGVSSALSRLLPGAGVITLAVDARDPSLAARQVQHLLESRPEITAVVAVDGPATSALHAPLAVLGPRRPVTLVTVIDAAAADLMARSLVDAVVGADICALTLNAVTAAVAAAENDAAAVAPASSVTVRTFTPSTGIAPGPGASSGAGGC